MPKSAELNTAKCDKKDEFYTNLDTIENELKHYVGQFAGKTVYCNCDNPDESNFWVYLHTHFDELRLKSLIATFYNPNGQGGKKSYTGGNDLDCQVGTIETLNGNGDFRSDECQMILNQADIVITNPPFSLFREYIKLLVFQNKRFLVLGNINAITYKDFFPLIQDNKIWLGASIHSGDIEFRVPQDYPLNAATVRIDGVGNKYIRVKGIRWYTNLDMDARQNILLLEKKYTPEEYPKYSNYDAININKTSDIPADYYQPMGVPITFLDKYNPEQFEILGISGTLAKPIVINGSRKSGRFYIQDKRLYDRIVIQRKA